MRLKTLLLASAVCFLFIAHGNTQIPDGSIAPDWTLTDIDGNTHHLYDYLAQGKTVVIDFSATWCGPCWAYHNSGALENLYHQYGPNGTGEFMVFFIEADLNTDMNDLNGTDPASQGDWVSGTSYPIIDLQNAAVSNAYQIGFFPTIFTICPSDYTVYESGQASTAVHATWLQSCALSAELDATTDAICYGDGSASISVTGGLSPFSYDWSDGSDDPGLTNVGGGVYAVTVTEGNGKMSVIDNIVINGAEQEVVINNTLLENNLCFGDMTGQLAVDVTGGTPGYSFAWSSSADPGFTGNGDDYINQLPAGIYSLTVTDANGCTYQDQYAVTEPPLLEAVITNVAAEACDQVNGSIVFETTGGTGEITATLNGPAGTMTSTGTEFTGLSAGNYLIEFTDVNGCATTIETTVDFIEAPTVEVISDNVLTCLEPELTLEAQVAGGSGDVEFSWYTFEGNILSFSDNSTVEVDAPGEYFVEVVDFVTGCLAENGILVISEQDIPEVELVVSDQITCENTEVVIEAMYNSDAPNLDQFWSDPEGNILGQGSPFLTVTQGGEYTFHLIDQDNGCNTEESAFVIQTNEMAEADFNFQVTELLAVFEDLSTGNITSWSWDFGDGNTSTDPNPVHTYATDGIYNVCLTATNGCGSNSICQEVIAQSDVTAIVVSHLSTDNTCFGASDGSIELNVLGGAGGFTFQWSGPDGFTSSDKDLTGLPAGMYEVLITDVDGNSTGYTVHVDEPEPIGLDISEMMMASCFGEQDGRIAISASGGTPPYTYLWNNGTTGETIDQLAAGEYAVVVTDANGCQFEEAGYVITQPEALGIDEVVISDVLCFGDSNGSIGVTISGGTGPFEYMWGNGSQEAQNQGLEAGSYKVSVTDANGCLFISEDLTISQPLAIQVEATSVRNASSATEQDGGIEIEVSGGVPPYQYMWSNGQTEKNLADVGPGIYTLTVTDANGCVVQTGEIEISFSVSTADPSFSKAILISPNPASTTVFISWKLGGMSNLEITVYNSLGQRVGRTIENNGTAEGHQQVDVSGWEAGLYFISIRSEDKTAIKKLMVE